MGSLTITGNEENETENKPTKSLPESGNPLDEELQCSDFA